MVTIYSRESIKDQEIDRLGYYLGIALKRAEAAEAELAKAQDQMRDVAERMGDDIETLRSELAKAREALEAIDAELVLPPQLKDILDAALQLKLREL